MFATLLIPPTIGHSQDYVGDMKKITERFTKGDISFREKYCFYPSDSIKKVADSINIYCCLSGQNYYYKITSGGKSFEYYKNSKYYFVVDHSESAIAVKKSPEAQQQMWDISKVDSLIHSQGVKITYKDLESNKGEYDIAISGKLWNRLKLVFNKSDYSLEKMYVYSSSKGKMYGTTYNKPMIVIYYSGYSEKQLDKSIFSESKYFYDTKDAIVLGDSYKKYTLLDYVYKMSKRG